MSANLNVLTTSIREAARSAFSSVRAAHPKDHFYYFALVTTADALRPGPSASSQEGLAAVLEENSALGHEYDPADLRWSEADSPYNLEGDNFFADVDRLFLDGGDHRALPAGEFEAEVRKRYQAMEQALRDLDGEGFFGTPPERYQVVINIVAPGDEDEATILQRAARLNPPESLVPLRRDFSASSA
jgi:hypothetical protein